MTLVSSIKVKFCLNNMFKIGLLLINFLKVYIQTFRYCLSN